MIRKAEPQIKRGTFGNGKALRFMKTDVLILAGNYRRNVMKQSGATEGDIEGLAALPRQVEGVLIAATLRGEKKKAASKISVRRSATIWRMLLPFCAQFGGGGRQRCCRLV